MGGSEIYKSTVAALLCLSAISPALAEAPSPQTQAVQLTAQQLFAFADAARDRGDFATADAAYRALATNPSIDLRSEARFRLALMLAYRQHKLADAGVVLRQILDERPKAARVRLELARIDALLGHMGAADRELRAAEAAGLPPAVEQQVQFYAQALDAKRPVGGSLSVSLAPDSNINHATSSNTLNTIIGQFQLNNQAQAQSGVGLSSQAQGFVRQAYSSTVSLLAQLSGSANIYRQSTFDDLILAPQIGPEINLGRDRLSVSLGPAWRWYGNVPYTFSLAASGDWQHRLTTREQLRVNASFARDATNQTYTMTVGAKSPSFGPASIDTALTNAAETVYQVKTGTTTTDSLTLTNPGTSGRFNYQYVGAALWQNTNVTSSTTGNGALYALTYGEPTPSAAVPKSGVGLYAIDVLGAQGSGGSVFGFTGTGTVAINLATDVLVISGTGNGPLSGTGTLTSSGSFSGDFTMAGGNGAVTGRLYGPNAQEIGGSFYANGTGFTDVTDTTIYAISDYIVFGLTTTSMPTSGTATYSGVVFGKGTDPALTSGNVTLGGTGQLSANFGAGTLSTTLNLSATPTAGGAATSLGSYVFPGNISGSTITGSFNTQSANGTLNGSFFGPNAAEVGAVFNLQVQALTAQAGYLSGVFVGKKN